MFCATELENEPENVEHTASSPVNMLSENESDGQVEDKNTNGEMYVDTVDCDDVMLEETNDNHDAVQMEDEARNKFNA